MSGCLKCGAKFSYKEKLKIIWTKRWSNGFICSNCKTSYEVSGITKIIITVLTFTPVLVGNFTNHYGVRVALMYLAYVLCIVDISPFLLKIRIE